MQTTKKEFVLFGLIIFVIAISSLLGCNKRPSRVPVKGQVLLDGKPLSYGQIVFVPDNGRKSTGKLDSEGRFTLTCLDPDDGAMLGNQTVEILAGEEKSATKMFWHAPKKYSSYNTSGIKKVITEKTDNLLVEITWKGNPPGKPYIEDLGKGSDGDYVPVLKRKKITQQ